MKQMPVMTRPLKTVGHLLGLMFSLVSTFLAMEGEQLSPTDAAWPDATNSGDNQSSSRRHYSASRRGKHGGVHGGGGGEVPA